MEWGHMNERDILTAGKEWLILWCLCEKCCLFAVSCRWILAGRLHVQSCKECSLVWQVYWESSSLVSSVTAMKCATLRYGELWLGNVWHASILLFHRLVMQGPCWEHYTMVVILIYGGQFIFENILYDEKCIIFVHFLYFVCFELYVILLDASHRVESMLLDTRSWQLVDDTCSLDGLTPCVHLKYILHLWQKCYRDWFTYISSVGNKHFHSLLWIDQLK